MSVDGPRDDDRELLEAVGRGERRKRVARERQRGVWFGLGMFGLIGWAVSVPMLVGLAAGIWLDARGGAGGYSWTLMLLLAGTALGALNASYWVNRQRRALEREREAMRGEGGGS